MSMAKLWNLRTGKAIEQLKTQMHDLYFVNSSFIEIEPIYHKILSFKVDDSVGHRMFRLVQPSCLI